MNADDEYIDLGLALGCTNYITRTRLNDCSGAGVNAYSKVDMPFAASDTLFELVWSPHSGLSVKCADSSIANKKHVDLQNTGPSSKDISTSQCIKSNSSGDKRAVDKKKLTVSHVDGDAKFGDKATMSRSSRGSSSVELLSSRHSNDCKYKIEECSNGNAIKDGNVNGKKEEDLSVSNNAQLVDISECSKKNSDEHNRAHVETKPEVSSILIRRTDSNRNSQPEFNGSNTDATGLALQVCSEPHREKPSKAPFYSLPSLVLPLEPDGEVTSSSRNINRKKTRNPISVPIPPLRTVQSSSLGHLATRKELSAAVQMELRRDNVHPPDQSPTNSRICLYQKKGKEKVLSDGNIHGRSDDEGDSHESAESCNSTVLLLKGIKRKGCDLEQPVQSKRLKMHSERSPNLTSSVNPNGSFLNWMSNMVKGLSSSNKQFSPPLSLALARSNDVCTNNHPEGFNESPKLGFQTMFQSLYCQNTKLPHSGIQKDHCSIDESKKVVVGDKKLLEHVSHLCHSNNDSNCKQIVLHKNEANQHISRTADFACASDACEKSLTENKGSHFSGCNEELDKVSLSHSLPKHVNSAAMNTPSMATSSEPGKSSALSSLWITRLYTKSDRLENCNRITNESVECSTEFQTTSIDLGSTHKVNSIQLPINSRSSEAMTSVFAKRLDALRHIINPSEKRKLTRNTELCFFCGRHDHDLRKCPELKENVLDDLLVNISASDRMEEFPSFCIRCFQFDHWASWCPLVPAQKHRRSQPLGSGHYFMRHLQLCAGDDDGKENVVLKLNESPSKPLSSSNEFHSRTASYSKNDSKSMLKFPPISFISSQSVVAQEEMFTWITKLRLSRADVLRWMNSNFSSSSLNGFFLRLRLGKVEVGPGQSGYYAARIIGDQIENADCTSKKSILVDVGGVKSSVGSQYISNHDFLEAEIKEWWSRIVKTGRNIPSVDELNSKFEERKYLGF